MTNSQEENGRWQLWMTQKLELPDKEFKATIYNCVLESKGKHIWNEWKYEFSEKWKL